VTAFASPAIAAPEEPVLVRIAAPDAKSVEVLVALDLDIVTARPGESVDAYVVRKERQEIEDLGFELQEIPDRSREYLLSIGEQGYIPSLGREWTSYPTYEQMTSWLQGIENDPAYAGIVDLFSIGRSHQGRDLWVVKISDNVAVEEAEPEFRYISSLHGNEVLGVPLCLNLIEHLLVNYVGGDPAVVDLVDNREIFILPLANPDGYVNGSRYNAQGTDLNRDFPDFVTDPDNTPDGRATETAVLMNWQPGHTFVLSANFHTGALVVNYPWDSTHDLNPDDTFFYHMSLGYSFRNPPMWNSSVFTNGVVRGSEWYVIHGGIQDWSYYWYAEYHVTIELSDSFAPPASQIAAYWDDNRDAMLYLIDLSGKGLVGTVTDAQTGDPVAAEVQVHGIDMPTTVTADPEHGNYVRPLHEGVYDVTYSAYGYFPVTLQNVRIDWEQATVRDVALEPMPEEPVLRFDSIAVDDGLGDGNGSIDPGETVLLSVSLENIGIGTATGVSGRLTVANLPYVSLHQGVSMRPGAVTAFPDIPDQSTASGLTPFVLDVSPDAPTPVTLPCRLVVTADGGISETVRLYLTLGGTVFGDDMEGGDAKWTHHADQGVDDWSIVVEGSAHSPVHCWFSSDVGSVKDAFLITEPFDLARKGELSFWHRYDMESGYDGCVIEISVGGGAWTDLGPCITQGGYDQTISTSYQSPIGGRMAWTGNSGSAMTEVRADLSAFRGASVRVRWRLACDSSVNADGWYVDDVTIQGEAATPASPQAR
jgi:carboxypeptidase D